MTTIRDLANHCGVSTATVSRALAGKEYIREELRHQIQQAAEELGYRPNLVARNLRSSSSTTIGLVVADVQNPFFTRICRAVEDEALRQGYAVFLCNSDEDADKEQMYLRHLADENVAGVIVAPTGRTKPEQLTALKLPMVLIDRPLKLKDADSVLIDNAQACFELTRHMIDQGRRKICGLFGSQSLTAVERVRGFWQAVEQSGIDREGCKVLNLPPREEEGYRATVALLAEHPEVDALIVSNGLTAAGVFRALRESGRRCPEQIRFATFDEAAWTSLVEPPVTVIEQPTYEIGLTAAELLLQRIKDPARAQRRLVLQHGMRVRASSVGYSAG